MDKVKGTTRAILIAGAGGFLGRSLGDKLAQSGFGIVALSRKSPRSEYASIEWSPSENYIDAQKLTEYAPDGFEAVINLAGENIGSKRWNDKRKRELRNSRIDSTKFLAACIDAGSIRTSLLINASATGFYGNRGEEILTERSDRGRGFLAELCSDWEVAASLKPDSRTRTVMLRLGVVLDGREGALARLLPIFRTGLGGALGSGRQYFPWISLKDFSRIVLFIIDSTMASYPIEGPVNVVSPDPVRNSEFTTALAKTVGKPAFLKVPDFILKAALGEFASEGLLSSQRVVPEKLLKSGYEYVHADIESTIRASISGR